MSSAANGAANSWPDKCSHPDVVYVKLNQMNGLVTQTSSVDSGQLVLKRIFSALFYAISSFLIIVINKIVLTNYKLVLFVEYKYRSLIGNQLIVIDMMYDSGLRVSHPLC